MTRFTLAAAITFSLAQSAVASTMLFDFGRTDRQSPAPPNVPTWNNIVPATTDLFALFDDEGNIVPGASLSITDTFFQTGEPSQLGAESPSGDAAGYPVDATDDYFFGHTGAFAGAPDNQYGEVTLRGLDPNLVYSFKFFSSRNGVGDSRETMAEVTGANSGSGLMTTSNNQSEVLQINGIRPDGSNEITLGFRAGPNNDNNNGFYYINLVEVNSAIPEPATGLLVALFGAVASAARLRVRR